MSTPHGLRESGEDYLYPPKNFVIIDVPAELRGSLLRALLSIAASK